MTKRKQLFTKFLTGPIFGQDFYFLPNVLFYIFQIFYNKHVFTVINFLQRWALHLFTYHFFSAALGVRCYTWAFSSCGKWRLLSSCGAWASHCRGFSCCGAWALECASSVAVAHRLSCPVACGIFLDQGSTLCPMHWQRNSQPVDHQGSPGFPF